MGLIHFDLHAPSNRVVSRRWPAAELYGDVRTLDEEMVRGWLSKYLGIQEVHLWSGFPCTDLSSANALGQGLQGPASSLFFEVLRIRDLLRSILGHHIKLKQITENVASMKPSEEATISGKLEQRPYFLDPGGCSTYA